MEDYLVQRPILFQYKDKCTQLIKKHFMKKNNLSKIFNRNIVKVTYNCPDITSVISLDNSSILKPHETTEWDCIRRSKQDLLL